MEGDQSGSLWPGAVRSQLDAQRNFGSPITLSGTSQTTQQLPALAEGTYFWRVRAVTDLGVNGAWSGVRSFVIDIP